MSHNMLVAYASKRGSTREIAEEVARVLFERGADVEVTPVDDVVTARRYGGVVAGSAVYTDDWLPQFCTFLREFGSELAGRPVWLFSSGPAIEDADTLFPGGRTYPAAMEKVIKAIGPRDLRLFAGMVNPDKLSLEDWCIYRALRGVTGDFKDWREIEDWAHVIATAMGFGGSGDLGRFTWSRPVTNYGAN